MGGPIINPQNQARLSHFQVINMTGQFHAMSVEVKEKIFSNNDF